MTQSNIERNSSLHVKTLNTVEIEIFVEDLNLFSLAVCKSAKLNP